MLAGQSKWSTLAAARLFVLPSFQEGLSIALLEALGMRLPVLATTECHLPEIATRHCGWVTETAVDPVRRALEEFFEMSPEEASQSGQRGKDLVEQRFRWPVVGKQMAQLYEWLEGGDRPSSVEIV